MDTNNLRSAYVFVQQSFGFTLKREGKTLVFGDFIFHPIRFSFSFSKFLTFFVKEVRIVAIEV